MGAGGDERPGTQSEGARKFLCKLQIFYSLFDFFVYLHSKVHCYENIYTILFEDFRYSYGYLCFHSFAFFIVGNFHKS